MQTFGFDEAIRRLKAGERVARAGWNGKGMFLWLKLGSFDGDKDPGLIAGVRTELFDGADDGRVTRMPCLCMRAAGGETVEGWLASQTDMLADDWMLVDG